MDQKVLFKVHMPKSVDKPLLEVLHSGFIGQGKKVDEFEEQLAQYFGNDKVLTLNSGTSGLHLALRLANVGHGDEVITTAMTCTATNMPILAAGAKIVWADVDPETGLISPESIKAKITNKTKDTNDPNVPGAYLALPIPPRVAIKCDGLFKFGKLLI